ncbi:VIT family protein [Thiomicrorhabdus sp. Milos-T2]|uniref:VIT1/CCC1 transporter family protein n=1 Tax=Thiomicrorhabdus sp. Milos-T2 TaxID=90814 RepID=UPI000494498D|nr:VIT family protein [Thiomicrorhabdus sp. Milos-T2]
MSYLEHEDHKTHRVGWLRAAVMGANDGIVSTASLIIGVAAAGSSQDAIIVAGVAGLVAGALSMAAGEYVSVSSQADTELADLKIEAVALEAYPEQEKAQLAEIYENRGLTPELAKMVADQLMQHNALDAHARDEIGISVNVNAQPLQAALTSALTFTVGAALPLLLAWFAPLDTLIYWVGFFCIALLAIMGAIAAYAGGASLFKGAFRVGFWGALAMALTAVVGQVFEVTV